ncbi:MAG TPA: hypothetical protein VFS43_33670 [Polyangiaceae bacterium]|nr:hypothetical protein [Polyangiaceae bacterium]
MLLRTRFALAAPPALFALACAACAPAEAGPPRSPAPDAARAPSAPAPSAAPAPSEALRAALENPARTAAERARDAHRHPGETLAFFGLREDMNVVEIYPGGGWYTAILAPYLRDKGSLTIFGGDPKGPPGTEGTVLAKRLADRFASAPETFGKVRVLVEPPSGEAEFGPEGSADAVLVFREIHGWIAAGETGRALAKVRRVLKPGGVLGLEAHRAAPGAPSDPKTVERTGYVPEAEVIRLVEAAGFRLAGRSEVNANPRDTRDHPEGVWTLPPTFVLKDKDRAKYEAIGESDRMTLKFVKL